MDLVQSLNLGPIWQASDSLSPRPPGSARRPFLKFAPEPPEAPWGIHKHNCNSSRTVWENAGKKNETLFEISVPGTGAFPHLLTVPAQANSGDTVRRRSQQAARVQYVVPNFSDARGKIEIKDLEMRKTIKRSDTESILARCEHDSAG